MTMAQKARRVESGPPPNSGSEAKLYFSRRFLQGAALIFQVHLKSSARLTPAWPATDRILALLPTHTRSIHPPIIHTHTLTHISRSHPTPCLFPRCPHTPLHPLPCADCARIPSSASCARGEWPGPCNIQSFDPAGREHLYPRHLASSSFCRHRP